MPLRKSLCILLTATACTQSPAIPPDPAPPGFATFVSAPFELTWNTVLDHLAGVGIPVATIDRDSERITTERVAVGPAEADRYADCGSRSSAVYRATSVVYDVIVGDDGSSSTVLVTASWDTRDPSAPFPCETKGVTEAEMQETIKLATEANR